MNSNLHIFETPDETARAIASLILLRSKEKSKQSLPFNLAVSGGNTPKLLFTILANEFIDEIPWHIMRLFWVDERCVPPTHPESNFGMTYESLLKFVPIHDSNIFRMQGEIDPETEAVRYAGLIEKELPAKNGIPQFDLILLGLGDDGHTASIFPDNLNLLHSDSTVSIGIHPTSGQKRITLTGTIINQATEVVFFITGSSKAPVLQLIIQKAGNFQKFPASYIHSCAGSAEFYTDRSAVSDLQ